MSAKQIITIDGPAASGKSTTAHQVAKRLGWQYLDTGAMYRAVGLAMLRAGIDPEDRDAVCDQLDDVTVDIEEGDPAPVLLNGDDVTGEIRSPEAAQAASQVATLPCVREKLVEAQRRIAEKRPCVLEGRDTGTVVFPDAGLKIFLDAPAEERAKRRLMEQVDGIDMTLDQMIEEVRRRDERDKNREVSPLTRADDAIVLDTGPLTAEEQIEQVLELARKRFGEDAI